MELTIFLNKHVFLHRVWGCVIPLASQRWSTAWSAPPSFFDLSQTCVFHFIIAECLDGVPSKWDCFAGAFWRRLCRPRLSRWLGSFPSAPGPVLHGGLLPWAQETTDHMNLVIQVSCCLAAHKINALGHVPIHIPLNHPKTIVFPQTSPLPIIETTENPIFHDRFSKNPWNHP